MVCSGYRPQGKSSHRFLNGATRKSQGWNYLQLKIEEADESVRGRAIDLVAAPSGVLIWIESRRFSQYEALFPMEGKRLPTPMRLRRPSAVEVVGRPWNFSHPLRHGS